MVVVKSNVDKVIKSFTKFRNAVKLSLEDIGEKIALLMVQDMQEEIERNRNVWLQPNGNLENVGYVDYTITKIEGNKIRVTLGDAMPLIQVGDTYFSLPHNQHTEYVNPLYFIEFGWGCVGEENPKQLAQRYSWEYNTNDHGGVNPDPWGFYGNDGFLTETRGREGINFLYNTIQDYRDKWKTILVSLIKENM